MSINKDDTMQTSLSPLNLLPAFNAKAFIFVFNEELSLTRCVLSQEVAKNVKKYSDLASKCALR